MHFIHLLSKVFGKVFGKVFAAEAAPTLKSRQRGLNLTNPHKKDGTGISFLSIQGGFGGNSTGLLRLGDIADVSLGYQTPAMTLSRFTEKIASC